MLIRTACSNNKLMTKLVLLLDDSAQSLSELGTKLTAAGYQPLSVAEGENVLARFREVSPEMVFISLTRSGPTEACELIRNDPDGAILPIVFIGHEHPQVRSPADALSHGADFFFDLPLKFDRVLAKVRTYIGAGGAAAVAGTALAAPGKDADASKRATAAKTKLAASTPFVPNPADELLKRIAQQDAERGANKKTSAIAARAASSAKTTETRSPARSSDVAVAKPADVPRALNPTFAGAAVSAIDGLADTPGDAIPGSANNDTAVTSSGEPLAKQSEPALVASGEVPARVVSTIAAVVFEASSEARDSTPDSGHDSDASSSRSLPTSPKAVASKSPESVTKSDLADKLRRDNEERDRQSIERKDEFEAERKRREEQQQAAIEALQSETDHAAIVPATSGSGEAESPSKALVAAASTEPAKPTNPTQLALRPSSPPEPTEGNLDTSFDIASLCFEVFRRATTGRIDFAFDGHEKTLFFEQGAVVAARSSQAFDRIEDYLLREGKITRARYQAVRVKGMRTARQVGAFLVEEGHLKAQDLFEAVRGHLRDVFCSLFEWEQATYRYVSERAPEDDVVMLDVDPRALIFEAIRRKYVMLRLVAKLGGPNSLLALLPDATETIAAMELDQAEQHLVRLVDGTHTIEDIVFGSKLEALHAYQLLGALLTAGSAKILVRGLEGLDRDGSLVAEKAERDRIIDKLEQVRNLNYFEMLGLAVQPTPYEIELALEHHVREFAADRFSEAIRSEFSSTFDEIAQILDEARIVLEDDALRDEYAKSIPS